MSISSPSVPSPLTVGGKSLSFDKPRLMGIVNVTPDSFSDGGRLTSVDAAVAHAEQLVEAGADILDVGGESTRPGAAPVSLEEEAQRVLPIVRALVRRNVPAWISVDTQKAALAHEAIQEGAQIINDVSALADPEMASVAAQGGAAVILMHMRGTPESMQEGDLRYDDLIAEVGIFLANAIFKARAADLPKQRLMVDPGIGFGKTTEHNLTLTKRLDVLGQLGLPVVYGPSRKRFLGELTGAPVEDRDRATAAACAAAVLAGAHIVRVHDVAAVRDAVTVAAAVRDAP